ncbi:protein mono-ADP-ribosyltransferase PARP10 [Amia ocellicauda]|uniref:protein mono-ADP-ribosyltransferase PARP10 n=1 Tax=Amia ocellicauda TaxID=2972642 RepID=UPI003464C5D4
MSETGEEERTVEVSGIPAGVEDEFLGLYFENKRRSGGGALALLNRNGSCAVLVFEDAEVAQRVLSQETHILQNAKLTVRRPAPKDPGKLLLRRINPHTSMEILELYVENVTGMDSEDYTIYPGPAGDLALIQFHQPLSETEFKNLSEKINKKLLDGARIIPEQIVRTDTVLVENLRPTTTEDMLTLYFENKRGGGEEVKDVSLQVGGKAMVSFENYEAVDRIIKRSHKLDGSLLEIQPYFDFLQPKESPSSPCSVNGKVEANGDAIIHPDSSEHIQIDSSEPVQPSTLSTLPAKPAETLRTSIPDTELAEPAQVKHEDSPQLHSSSISLPDPLKLSLLQSSSLLQDLQARHQNLQMYIADNAVKISGPSQLEIEQIKNHILEFFSAIAQAHLPFDAEKAIFLSKVEVQEKLLEMLKKERILAMYTVSECVVTVISLSLDMVKQACSLIKTLICDFTIPISPEYECMLYSKEWSGFLSSLGFCSAKVSDRGDQIEVMTLREMEEDKQSKIVEFLSTPIQVESVITMEPGMLKYIQTHCHTLLADMDQVSIFPLEAEDVTGLRLHGNANACQIADELLRSVVSSVCTRTITLQRPGVARFLVQEEGTSILHEIQTKFQVFISLERIHWVPLEAENIFLAARKYIPQPNLKRFVSEDNGDAAQPLIQTTISTDVQINDLNRPEKGLLDEAKRLVSFIDEPSKALAAPSSLTSRGIQDIDLDGDLYTDQPDIISSDDEENVEESNVIFMEETPRLAPEGQDQEGLVTEDQELNIARQLSLESAKIAGNLEEDAMLSLAIQFSMESKSKPVEAEDELQKALALSMKMHEQDLGPTDPGLDKAMYASLQDAIQSAHTAQILVYAGYTSDLIRVDIALGKKVGLRQCEEKVQHKCLLNLSDFHRKCVDIIQRKHAVDIQIEGNTATIKGFKDFVSEAVPNMKKLIKRISGSVSDSEIVRSIQWVWNNGKSQSIPYPPEAIVFIENAYKMREKKIDVVFDNQPYTIDFEKMVEFSIASGKSVPIARQLLRNLDLYTDLPEEMNSLSSLPDSMIVSEETDEYQEVVKDFYDTIREYHSKIKIVKVEKLVNALLYNQYKLKKASMLQSATDPEVERTLYHGTSGHSVKEICIHGFNRSFCGKNATVYGQGVYFAVNSALSVQDQYSPPDAEGHKYVFVAKVLTGDYTKGRHEMKTAPLKEGTDIPLRYHSVVDVTDSPSLFVIFNDTQAYPEYLITCKKFHG